MAEIRTERIESGAYHVYADDVMIGIARRDEFGQWRGRVVQLEGFKTLGVVVGSTLSACCDHMAALRRSSRGAGV